MHSPSIKIKLSQGVWLAWKLFERMLANSVPHNAVNLFCQNHFIIFS